MGGYYGYGWFNHCRTNKIGFLTRPRLPETLAGPRGGLSSTLRCSRGSKASTSVTSGHSNGVGRSEQWGYPYIPLGHTRWCPRSYKLVYNPHKNYRYNPHKP